MTVFQAAWREGRVARSRRPARVALAVSAVRLAARVLPTWKRFRTGTIQTAGVAAANVGLFQISAAAGWIGIGVGLFVLEALSGEKQ